MTALAYEFIPIHETQDPLVELSSEDFILEPVYFYQGLSKTKKIYLRKTVVVKLLQIQKKLRQYRFKIWDGYRQRSVQKNIYQKFWRELQNNHPDWNGKQLADAVSIFVTDPDNPDRIPPHATGGAVDLTLSDFAGNELDMGTGFDFFGKEAEPFYFEKSDIDEKIKNNRKLLQDAMIAENFALHTDEWWHFNYGNQLWALTEKKEFALFGETYVAF
jgi:zinc D-Ala-D-Ala dipeptidase